jgi:phosphohistidine phosphatase SixA
MGRLLKKEDLVPEIIISSTATRARSTAEVSLNLLAIKERSF